MGMPKGLDAELAGAALAAGAELPAGAGPGSLLEQAASSVAAPRLAIVRAFIGREDSARDPEDPGEIVERLPFPFPFPFPSPACPLTEPEAQATGCCERKR